MAKNPFELAYDGIWEVIQKNKEITNIVKISNRIKFEDAIGPKDDIEQSDLPEIMVVPNATLGALNVNSSSTQLIKDYTIFLSTGQWELDKVFNLLSWELIKSLATWKINMTALQWNGRGFIKRVDLKSAEEGTRVDENTRAVLGWAAAAIIEVDMYFVTSDLVIT